MTSHKLKALVVEDETAIRLELISALEESPEIVPIGSAESLEEAYQLISTTKADLLFLDINLIGGDAFQLINLLKRHKIDIPPIVISTGCNEFGNAQRIHNEYRNEVIYIIRKPFNASWMVHQENILDAAYSKIQDIRLAKLSFNRNKLIPFQTGKQSYFVKMEDIILVRTGTKGHGKTNISLEHQTISCHLSLSQTLNCLSDSFIQINRFEVINIQYISLLDHSKKQVHLNNGYTHVIGPRYYKALCKRLGLSSSEVFKVMIN